MWDPEDTPGLDCGAVGAFVMGFCCAIVLMSLIGLLALSVAVIR